MFESFLTNFLLALVAIDPISLVPIFAGLTAGFSPREIRKVSVLATAVSFFVVIAFYIFGSALLEVMGISMASFRIIGGIFLIAVAFEMVFEHRATRRSATAQTASEDKTLSSIAVFPVAIPLIAGPATITLAILARGDAESGPLHWILPVLPLVLVIAMAGLFMLLSSFIVEKIGQTVSLVLQRLFGLLLGALAIEFVIRGIRDTFGI